MRGPGEDVPSILDALAGWATATPNATALVSPGREPATYGELQGAVVELAAELFALNLRRGDGIALLFPEGPNYCLAMLAAISVGVSIPLAWPHPRRNTGG